MSNNFDPELSGDGLPYINQAIAESLLNGESPDDEPVIARTWKQLSVHNPYLRDYITIKANLAEPDDLEARQYIINIELELLGALTTATTINNLYAKWGASFEGPASSSAQPQETISTNIEPFAA